MKYKVKLTFIEPLLGTVPKDQEVYATYIATKSTDPMEEIDTVPDNAEEKGWTGFHEKDGRPFLYDYVIKGFFKDACSMLRRSPGTLSKKMTAHKKVIDGLIFPRPRKIFIEMNGQGLTPLERPLRAQTAQGERVALARSDCAPAGASITFELLAMMDTKTIEPLLHEWFAYGEHRGLGQWRNAGYGSFTYELEAIE